MQVSVESPSKIQRRVTIVVPVDKLDQVYDQHIIKLSRTVKINGFRPGKAPLDVVKKRFGDAAHQEAISELIQNSLYSAIDKEKLNPVETPKVEPVSVVPGQPLQFVATFEILPTIEKVNFDLATLEKQIATIKDEDIDKVITHLREQHKTWNKVERAAQDKDQVIVDFNGSIDGVAFQGGQAHEYPVTLGSNTMIPGFEEGIMGAKVGEERKIKVSFPESYFAKDVAGKTAEFAIKVHKIMEPVLPELNEGFVKKLGVKSASIEDFRGEINKNLQRELERVTKLKVKAQVFDKLLEQNPVEVPKVLIEREAQRIHAEVHPHHKGHDHGHSAEEMQSFTDAATRNVALGLIVGELVRQNGMKPSKEGVDTFIDNLASAYENPSEVTKWYKENKKALAEIEMQVLEEQVMEKLLNGVNVTEKMLSYSELVSNNEVA